MTNIDRTIEFVVKSHAGQYRKSSNNGNKLPYVFHPFAVAQLVWQWGAGSETVMKAALAHDVLEDCPVTFSELSEVIGIESANIVQELTFIPSSGLSKSEIAFEKSEYIKTFDKKSVEAILIKISDRYNNTMDFFQTDPVYAVKYFEKAMPLFETFEKRRTNLFFLGQYSQVVKTLDSLVELLYPNFYPSFKQFNTFVEFMGRGKANPTLYSSTSLFSNDFDAIMKKFSSGELNHFEWNFCTSPDGNEKYGAYIMGSGAEQCLAVKHGFSSREEIVKLFESIGVERVIYI